MLTWRLQKCHHSWIQSRREQQILVQLKKSFPLIVQQRSVRGERNIQWIFRHKTWEQFYFINKFFNKYYNVYLYPFLHPSLKLVLCICYLSFFGIRTSADKVSHSYFCLYLVGLQLRQSYRGGISLLLMSFQVIMPPKVWTDQNLICIPYIFFCSLHFT